MTAETIFIGFCFYFSSPTQMRMKQRERETDPITKLLLYPEQMPLSIVSFHTTLFLSLSDVF